MVTRVESSSTNCARNAYDLLGFFWPARITDCPRWLLVVSTIRLMNFFVSVDDALVGAAFEEFALSVDDIDISPVVVGDSLNGVGQLAVFIIHPDLCDVTHSAARCGTRKRISAAMNDAGQNGRASLCQRRPKLHPRNVLLGSR